MSPIPDIASINISARLALLTDGTMLPITVLIDALGCETTDVDEASAFVCGSPERGWYSDLISAYAKATVQ